MTLKRLFLSLLLFMMPALLAEAGSLTLRDEEGLLTLKASVIEAACSAASFDTVLIVSSSKGRGVAFDSYIDSAFPSPNNLVIGIDPLGRHTHIWAGPRLGLPSPVVGTIAIAANQSFRAGDWASGVVAMLQKAALMLPLPQPRQATAPVARVVTAPPQPLPPSTPIDWWTLTWSLIAGGSFVWFVVVLVKKSRRLEEESRPKVRSYIAPIDEPVYRAALRENVAMPIAPRTYYAPPAPVVVQQGGGGILGGSPILDYMLVDNLMHSHNERPAVVEHHYEAPPAPRYDPPAPSYSEPSSGGSDFGASVADAISDASSGGSDW